MTATARQTVSQGVAGRSAHPHTRRRGSGTRLYVFLDEDTGSLTMAAPGNGVGGPVRALEVVPGYTLLYDRILFITRQFNF